MSDSPARWVRPELRELSAYSLHLVPSVHKLDQNEVPWDLPGAIKRLVTERLLERNWAHYPDFHSDQLRAQIAERNATSADRVLVGNGSNELLALTLEAVVHPRQEVLSLLPGFGLYDMFVRRAGGRIRFLEPRGDLSLQMSELLAEVEDDPTRPVLLCTPNNPTGAAADPEDVQRLAELLDAPLLLDNAYGEFCRHDYRPLLEQHRHVVIFRTFSKAWSLAGLRLGYVLADADLIHELIKIKLPYNLGWATATAGEVLLERSRTCERAVRVIVGRREQWARALSELGFEVFPSEANFLLVRHPRAQEIHARLAEQGILVRKVWHYPGLENCLRVAVGSGPALRDMRAAVSEILEEPGGARESEVTHE